MYTDPFPTPSAYSLSKIPSPPVSENIMRKDAACAAVRDVTDKEVAEFEQYIKEARPKEYERIKNWFETLTRMPFMLTRLRRFQGQIYRW